MKLVALVLFLFVCGFQAKIIPYTSWYYNLRVLEQYDEDPAEDPSAVSQKTLVETGPLVDANTMAFRFLSLLLVITVILMVL